MQKSGGSIESKALKELVELPCWKVIITLKEEGNLASADRKYVMQFQHRVARDKIAHKLKKKTNCREHFAWPKCAMSKLIARESFVCRRSSVLATDAYGDYILHLQGGVHIPDPGCSSCWQILLNGDRFS